MYEVKLGCFAPPPPPPPICFSGFGTPVSSGFTAFLWYPWGPWWVCSPDFSDFSCTPTGSIDGTGWTFPTVDFWTGSTGNFFAESAASICSSHPPSSFLNWVDSDSCGVCIWPFLSRWSPGGDGRLLLCASVYFFWSWSRSSVPSTLLDLQSCDHILSVTLSDLGKLELLIYDLPKPRLFWELDQEVQVKSGAGALNIDQEMVAVLTRAFQEPSTMSKVTDATSTYKVPVDLYMALFKTRRRRWSSRSVLSVPSPSIPTSSEPRRRPMKHHWHPGILDGIWRYWSTPWWHLWLLRFNVAWSSFHVLWLQAP